MGKLMKLLLDLLQIWKSKSRPKSLKAMLSRISRYENSFGNFFQNQIKLKILQVQEEEEEEEVNLWEIPRQTNKVGLLWYFYSWPIRFVLNFTIPNPAKMRKWYPLTFIMCIVWLAGTSYFVFWMVVIIGYTFTIPEPVMGLTLLAMGGCLPVNILNPNKIKLKLYKFFSF